jgi:NAD(P)-dependent dehydrogenase (short-subunit alcohol dehydrogenase family)
MPHFYRAGLLWLTLLLLLGGIPVNPALGEDSSGAPSVLITGSNRGIGLEFVRQYAEEGWQVIATCRSPAKADALQAIAGQHANVRIEAMDIADADSVSDLAERLQDQPVDLLLNNAAYLGQPGEQQFPDIDFEVFERILAVNTMGTTRVSVAFREHVAASQQKKIVILGSAAGSIGQVSAAPNTYLPYRASKAGLHLIARNLSLALAEQGITVGLINPGLVDTRGVLDRKPGEPVPEEFVPIMPLIEKGLIELQRPADSVRDMRLQIARMSPESPGLFMNYDGREVPW